MRRSGLGGLVLALVLGIGACTEELSTPADCPSLCPGTGLVVKDTTILANAGQDSSFSGYLGAQEVSALLISNGLVAGEARAFAGFPSHPDSVTVDGLLQPFTIDSAVVIASLIARDSTVGGLTVFYHRLPPHIDTTATLADIDALMTPATLIDSATVPDTLHNGVFRLVLPADKMGLLTGAPEDSGRVGIGFRIGAPEPTGIRIGSTLSAVGGPLITFYGRVPLTDTAKVHQTLTVFADTTNYVIQTPPPTGDDHLVMGGKFGTRTIIRFTIPRVLRDSASVLRATLELTPVGPLLGLNNDSATVQIRAVLADLGAKSPTISSVSAIGLLPAGATAVQEFDVRSIVDTWFGAANTAPTTFLMGVFPEGGSFQRPEFFSSRAPSGPPRLRVTYALPSRPGHP